MEDIVARKRGGLDSLGGFSETFAVFLSFSFYFTVRSGLSFHDNFCSKGFPIDFPSKDPKKDE